jgi:hypothetical protein
MTQINLCPITSTESFSNSLYGDIHIDDDYETIYKNTYEDNSFSENKQLSQKNLLIILVAIILLFIAPAVYYTYTKIRGN